MLLLFSPKYKTRHTINQGLVQWDGAVQVVVWRAVLDRFRQPARIAGAGWLASNGGPGLYLFSIL